MQLFFLHFPRYSLLGNLVPQSLKLGMHVNVPPPPLAGWIVCLLMYWWGWGGGRGGDSALSYAFLQSISGNMCVWVGENIYRVPFATEYNLDCTLPDIYAFITALSDNPNFFSHMPQYGGQGGFRRGPVTRMLSFSGVGGCILEYEFKDFCRSEQDCNVNIYLDLVVLQLTHPTKSVLEL
jgi:hypothetical protein